MFENEQKKKRNIQLYIDDYIYLGQVIALNEENENKIMSNENFDKEKEHNEKHSTQIYS